MTPQTNEEWEGTLSVMHGLWKKRFESLEPEEAMSWRNTIGKYPQAWCIESLRWWHGNKKFFPKPPEIRELLKKKRDQYAPAPGPSQEGFLDFVTEDDKAGVREDLGTLSPEQIEELWDSLEAENPHAALARKLPQDWYGRNVWLHNHAKKLGLFEKEGAVSE